MFPLRGCLAAWPSPGCPLKRIIGTTGIIGSLKGIIGIRGNLKSQDLAVRRSIVRQLTLEETSVILYGLLCYSAMCMLISCYDADFIFCLEANL